MSEIKSPILLDTSALIEFLDKTERGEKIRSIIENSELILLPTIVIAEITTKLERKKLKIEDHLPKLIEGTVTLLLDTKIALESGKIHAELYKKDFTISLADCIIIAHSEKENAIIITTDNHFKSVKNALVIS